MTSHERSPLGSYASMLQCLRDPVILPTLLYHGLRRLELCAPRLVDL